MADLSVYDACVRPPSRGGSRFNPNVLSAAATLGIATDRRRKADVCKAISARAHMAEDGDDSCAFPPSRGGIQYRPDLLDAAAAAGVADAERLKKKELCRIVSDRVGSAEHDRILAAIGLLRSDDVAPVVPERRVPTPERPSATREAQTTPGTRAAQTTPATRATQTTPPQQTVGTMLVVPLREEAKAPSEPKAVAQENVKQEDTSDTVGTMLVVPLREEAETPSEPMVVANEEVKQEDTPDNAGDARKYDEEGPLNSQSEGEQLKAMFLQYVRNGQMDLAYETFLGVPDYDRRLWLNEVLNHESAHASWLKPLILSERFFANDIDLIVFLIQLMDTEITSDKLHQLLYFAIPRLNLIDLQLLRGSAISAGRSDTATYLDRPIAQKQAGPEYIQFMNVIDDIDEAYKVWQTFDDPRIWMAKFLASPLLSDDDHVRILLSDPGNRFVALKDYSLLLFMAVINVDAVDRFALLLDSAPSVSAELLNMLLEDAEKDNNEGAIEVIKRHPKFEISKCQKCADELNDQNICDLNDFRRWARTHHPDKHDNSAESQAQFQKVSDCVDEIIKKQGECKLDFKCSKK